VRRVITTLALALFVVGCGPVALLTGGTESCSIGGVAPMSIVGVLIADPQSGTAIRVDPSQTQWGPAIPGMTLPVMWPPGYTGRRLVNGEVEVLRAGEVVLTTGRRVALSTQFAGGLDAGAYTACGGRELPLATG
jgi:hypothetical protein